MSINDYSLMLIWMSTKVVSLTWTKYWLLSRVAMRVGSIHTWPTKYESSWPALHKCRPADQVAYFLFFIFKNSYDKSFNVQQIGKL